MPTGSRLPTREDLRHRYRVAPATLHRAFRRLIAEGFVVARGREGSFVSDRPPHLTRFAIVFPYRDRTERPWPQFWRALAAEAESLARARGHDLVFSYGNETHEDLEAYQALVDDVRHSRLAGLVFATKPFYLAGSPVLETPGIPRVAIMREPMPPNVRAVDLGTDLFGSMVDHLLVNGRRRIAAITAPPYREALLHELARRGVPPPAYWVQTTVAGDPAGTRALAHLLMAGRSEDGRPDGLLILDDNLVPDVTRGLLDARVRVPDDLLVVAHANFPHDTPSAVPAHRVGYDVRELLAGCFGVLDAERAGRPVTDTVVIPLSEAWSHVAAPPVRSVPNRRRSHEGVPA